LLPLVQPSGALTADGLAPGRTAEGVCVVSIGYHLGRQQPLEWKEPSGDSFVWRGTLEAGALREFLADVNWGSLDLLLIDLPPGAPRLVDLHDLVPDLTGILAVTIPTDESLDAVHRALAVARGRDVPILGLVENMAGFACPACGHNERVFPGDAGATLAAAFAVDPPMSLPFGPTPADQDRLAEELSLRLGLR
jgi:ATP-binding protein involved in chromosome partitioning